MRTLGQAAQRGGKHRGRQREIKNHILRRSGDRRIEIIKNIADAVFPRQRVGPAAGAVVDSPDGKPGKSIGRQVGILDDATSANDQDWKWLLRQNRRDFRRADVDFFHAGLIFTGKIVFYE
jgi:hypothetical protein